MPQLPRTRSTRTGRKRFWFDPRFAIGLVLVAASAAGVVAIVSAADSTVAVLSARGMIVPGERVDRDDLVEARVQLRSAGDLYLRPADLPDGGVIVTRTVAAGELLPLSAVSDVAAADETAMVLALDSSLPESVVAGSSVDVWASHEEDTGVFTTPTVIVAAATVVRLVDDDGVMMRSTGSAVEVLVPRSSVARVLESVANGASLAAVPQDLPLRR